MTAAPVRLLLRTIERRSAGTALAGLAVLLGACWAVSWYVGGSASVSRHLFYVPIVVGAARFGWLGGLATGVVAAVLAGPAVAIDAPVATWLGRGVAFVAIGMLVGAVVGERDEGLRRQRELTERERELASRAATIVQLVSHEFRTPLTVIRGGVATLRDRDGAVAAPFRGLLGGIDRASAQLDELVSGVLAAAGRLDVDVSQQSVQPIATVLERVRRSLPTSQRDRFCTRVEPPDLAVATVEVHLRVLLRSLVDNGFKFGPADGHVQVLCRAAPGGVAIRVRDQGGGVPAELGDRAFDPFTQADPSESRIHPGLGMGLFTARQLARRLGGDVGLEPGPGGGLEPLVTLPQRRGGDGGTDRRSDRVSVRR